MDFLCSGPVKKIFTHWIGTVFNLNFTIDEKDRKRPIVQYIKTPS